MRYNCEFLSSRLKPGSAQQIGITLWMFIRGVLVPKETSMFMGGLQRNAEILPAVNLSNVSVHDILDHIISLGQGGGWIMHEVPADWQSNPKTLPYELFSYSVEEASANLFYIAQQIILSRIRKYRQRK